MEYTIYVIGIKKVFLASGDARWGPPAVPLYKEPYRGLTE